jgi:hypothetical protein
MNTATAKLMERRRRAACRQVFSELDFHLVLPWAGFMRLPLEATALDAITLAATSHEIMRRGTGL